MTAFKPYLIVRRLLINSETKAVYDQEFRSGVNIIRGDNGTGKSTVMDMLFFALGGDVKEWTSAQERCDYVLCEVSFSGKILTLRRDIASSTSMYIYEGALDPDAPLSKFLVLTYRTSDRKESFSQTLFDYLELPRYQKSDSISLTMHQILRLIYVDQITPPNKILRQESSNFDSFSNRVAIGEYLLGIDDLESHNLRQQKSKLEKQSEAINVERNAIYRVLGRHSINVDEHKITDEIKELQQEKLRLQRSVNVVDKISAPNATIVAANSMASKVSAQKELLLQLESERARCSEVSVEGELFLDSIRYRLRAITEASAVSEDLGSMEFKFCPSCLSPITKNSSSGICNLCKSPNAFQGKGGGYLAERTSLNFQLAESTEILERNNVKMGSLQRKILEAKTELEVLLDEFKPVGSSIVADDPRYYQDAIRLGFIEKQLEQLVDNLNIVKEVDATIQKLDELNMQISKIESKLESTLQYTAARRNAVASTISSLVVKLLKRDLGYETAFGSALEFDFDFGRDVMHLDGTAKFSASSMTLLKNVFRFAIFYLSVEDKEMRYPRILIMDNIEDKGMVPARSQNFQRMIVEYCSTLKGEYQLIFSTSMIDPKLNESDLCRGPNYLKGEHTLSF